MESCWIAEPVDQEHALELRGLIRRAATRVRPRKYAPYVHDVDRRHGYDRWYTYVAITDDGSHYVGETARI